MKSNIIFKAGDQWMFESAKPGIDAWINSAVAQARVHLGKHPGEQDTEHWGGGHIELPNGRKFSYLILVSLGYEREPEIHCHFGTASEITQLSQTLAAVFRSTHRNVVTGSPYPGAQPPPENA
jgi:hypothetical protein